MGPARPMRAFLQALVAKPEDLSSIPRAHMVEEENQLSQVVACPPNACHGICTHTNAYMYTKYVDPNKGNHHCIYLRSTRDAYAVEGLIK